MKVLHRVSERIEYLSSTLHMCGKLLPQEGAPPTPQDHALLRHTNDRIKQGFIEPPPTRPTNLQHSCRGRTRPNTRSCPASDH